MQKFLIIVLTFICLYSVHIKGLPFALNVLVGVVGGGKLFYDRVITCSRDSIFKIPRSLVCILLASFLIIIVSGVSILFNYTQDAYFIKLVIINFSKLFAIYLLAKLIESVYGCVTFSLVVKYVVIAAVIQMVLSVMMYLNPTFYELTTNLLQYTELASDKMNELVGTRILGFSTMFFESGIIHGFVLILIVAALQFGEYSGKQYLAYIFSFILIFVGGMMLARTTLIGFGLALLLVLYNNRIFRLRITSKMCKSIGALVCIVLCSAILIYSLSEEVRVKMGLMVDFAFEMFKNYFNSGSIETKSTNKMLTMYVFPHSFKTWLIGDGLWSVSDGYGYYMSTDIGYCRMLFYFGLLGTFMFFLYQYVIIWAVSKKNMNVGRIVFVLLYLYCLILNLKGAADLFGIVTLFYFSKNSNDVKIGAQKRKGLSIS